MKVSIRSIGCSLAILSCIPFLVACSGGPESPQAVPKATPSSAILRVPSLEMQFRSINETAGGYPFTFRYWNNEAGFIGDDPTLCTHYQGATRVLGPDGESYLYLTRNGNPIFICSGTYDDYPGEILVVEMGDRNRDGESFEEGFTPVYPWPDQPSPEDHTVKSIHLNGTDLGPGVDWKHPGSGQQAGDFLFIPVEKKCNFNGEKCTGEEGNSGAILVFRVSDPDNPALTPANPEFACQIRKRLTDTGMEDLPFIGTLGVTRKEGKFLFAHTTGGGYNQSTALTFYDWQESKLCQGQEPGQEPAIRRRSFWNAGNLQDAGGNTIGKGKWRDVEGSYLNLDWQTISLLHDHRDRLYLIGTDKSGDGAAITVHDYARLFKIEGTLGSPIVKYIAEKHFDLKKALWQGNTYDLQIGDFDAVGSVYISPTGRLMIYSGTHDNDWPKFFFGDWPGNIGVCNGSDLCKSYPMGEFRSNYYHPPIVTAPPDGTTDEGSLALFQPCSFQDWYQVDQTWAVEADWSDGTIISLPGMPGEAFSLEHRYPDGPAEFTVKVTVTDSDGFSGDNTFRVTVNNVAPDVSIDDVSDESGSLFGGGRNFTLTGMKIDMKGSFTDPGLLDTHTAAMDWNDGGGFVDLPVDQASRTITGSHLYGIPGFYTIVLTVTDNDGGEGSANATLRVVAPDDALRLTCDALREIADDPENVSSASSILKAVDNLCGNNGGSAENGALDMLEKGNLNAVFVKLDEATRYLAQATGGSVDPPAYSRFTAFLARNVCRDTIALAEATAGGSNDLRKVLQAKALMAEGDRSLSGGAPSAAVGKYKDAVREVLGIIAK